MQHNIEKLLPVIFGIFGSYAMEKDNDGFTPLKFATKPDLSDIRHPGRAETVALILSQQFNVPPENLVTQGYGEQYLKIPTDGPERRNRRVTARRITPLLAGGQ